MPTAVFVIIIIIIIIIIIRYLFNTCAFQLFNVHDSSLSVGGLSPIQLSNKCYSKEKWHRSEFEKNGKSWIVSINFSF